MNNLESLRKKVDKTDEKIIELIAKRTGYVFQIARYKARQNMMIVDEKREKQVLARVKKLALENNISEDFAEELYKLIIEYCRGIQRLRH